MLRMTHLIGISGLFAMLLLANGTAQAVGEIQPTKPQAKAKFQLDVQPVLKYEDVQVYTIDIKARPGVSVRLVTDAPGKGGLSYVGLADEPLRLTILGNHVTGAAGSADSVKFLMRLNGAMMSSTGQMPKGARTLADVLTIAAKSGEYSEDRRIPMVTFEGVTYSLLAQQR